MKTLFLLRHAKADRELIQIRDLERPLAERGYNDAMLMSAVLKEQNLLPEKIISSPAVRAYTTALIFSNAFGFKPKDIRIEQNLYDSSPEDYRKVIHSLDDNFQSWLLAGHNDVISETASILLPGKRLEPMKTCGLVIITSDCSSWKDFGNEECKLILALHPALLREA